MKKVFIVIYIFILLALSVCRIYWMIDTNLKEKQDIEKVQSGEVLLHNSKVLKPYIKKDREVTLTSIEFVNTYIKFLEAPKSFEDAIKTYTTDSFFSDVLSVYLINEDTEVKKDLNVNIVEAVTEKTPDGYKSIILVRESYTNYNGKTDFYFTYILTLDNDKKVTNMYRYLHGTSL